MRVAIAQIDPIVGDFENNVKKIQAAYKKACEQNADILLTPELGICGYPPHDLLERPEIYPSNQKAVDHLCKITRGKRCALVVGYVAPNASTVGRPAQNMAGVLVDGKEIFRQPKSLLPTYDVFDETRYFEPAATIDTWNYHGIPISLGICEDLWAADLHNGKKIYRHDPVETYCAHRTKLILSIAASPYEWKKRERREALHSEVARRANAPLIYVNQTGATDEILFDGASFAVDAQGKMIGRLAAFEPAMAILKLGETPRWEYGGPREDQAPDEMAVLTRGLVLGMSEYFKRTGFKKAILGLSGGIDSAVVATLAVQALGAKNVIGVAMPSQYSSSHSLADAEALAENLGISLEVRPIKFLFSTFSRELAEGRGSLAPLALENLQARIRGNVLMTLANHLNALTLTTGNKSELAVGYCTLYGDMAGALAPIGDLFKTRVYDLARFLNDTLGGPIPQNTMIKAPSAELRPEQKDQDTLPPYEILDSLLEDYIEKKLPVSELQSVHGPKGKSNWVKDVLHKVELSEYKRLQAAPVLKTSSKAFGIGRRIPVAKVWD